MAQVYNEHPREYRSLGVLFIQNVIESIDKKTSCKKKGNDAMFNFILQKTLVTSALITNPTLHNKVF